MTKTKGIVRKRTQRPASKAGNHRHSYFRLRDFEYVQPLYDLAFFLEVDALANGSEVPKYRTFSLWRAAYSLDGYGTTIDRWLDSELRDEDLDYVPSTRIRAYLKAVRESGTIPELKPFRGERFERCLRLRAVRGLGPNKIALTISNEFVDEEWFTETAINFALDRDRLVDLGRGAFGRWQSAHLVPPLLRLLQTFEEVLGHKLRWVIEGLSSPLEPIVAPPTVVVSLETGLRDTIRKTLRREKLFRSVGPDSRGGVQIRHQMGWTFSIRSVTDSRQGLSIDNWIQNLDPLASNADSLVVSDLHLHTAWSDGSASVNTMAKAITDRGLTHFAVTDHSRTSKLQGGLTPPLWLRQANALALASPLCPVLHGIEVDILRDGELDLPHSLLRAADLVVASVHSNWSESSQTNTSRLLRAIQSGCVDILAHPTSALTGKPGVPDYVRAQAEVDWDEVLRACAVWKVALEFNCFPSRLDLPLSLLKKAVKFGCAISLGSDAHARSHLQNIRFGEGAMREIDGALVLNRLPLEELKSWLCQSRITRRTLPRDTADLVQADLFAEEAIAQRRVMNATIQLSHRIPEGSRIVGIDLTAGEKPTGVACLDGFKVETCSLFTDQEILAYIRGHQPQIVSIDSPLGLPGGGKSIDPKAGIVRVAEHELASIGIPAYPALIDSMRELTLRGIRLRRAIEDFTPAPRVIESYPGAAQDILCIPRKQKGLGLLREGLRRLGLTGTGLDTTSHDEMDAVTSAIVGRYFEAGKFEPMGIRSEAQLIVPKVPPLQFETTPVICLAGKSGAGKSVVARYLSVFYGFEWLRTRDLIRQVLEEDLLRPVSQQLGRGAFTKKITERDLAAFGALILTEYKQVPIRRKLTEMVAQSNSPLVVDAIRDVIDLEVDSVGDRPVLIWFIDCNDAIIRRRLASRSKAGVARLAAGSPVDQTAPMMRRCAQRIVNNNGTLEDLRWRVDDTFFADLCLKTP